MSVEAEGASGPQDNAAKVDPLDAALDKAMGPITDGSDDFPPLHLKEKLHGKKSEDKVAGDARTSEDAGKPAAKAGEAPEAPAAEAVSAAIEAPNHWDAERKQAFAALPPEGQKAMLAMAKNLEGGFTRKSQELSDQAKYAEAIKGIIDDETRNTIQQAGLDEVGYFRWLNQIQRAALRDGEGYVDWVTRQLGVDPRRLAARWGLNTQPEQHYQQHQPQQQVASTGDPKLDALLADPATEQLRHQFGQFSQQAIAKINALEHQLAQRAHQEQEYARQQHVGQVQSLQKQWTDFRSSQDDHGQLKYPHADTLKQQMGAIMQTDPQIAAMPDNGAKLDAAYQAALWARPDLRSGLLEQEKARALADAQKKAEAEKAKKAAAVRPATGAPTMPVKKGGLDAALDAAFAQHGSN